MSETLLEMVLFLLPLSLVAVGGAITVLPEVHRQVVEVHGWLTDAEFAALFALSQAAPGPNVLLVGLIGWRVAGLLGAPVALLAICGPSSLLTFALASAWGRLGGAPWQRAIQAGLAPVAVGLVLASVAILYSGVERSIALDLVIVATVVLVLRTKLHPLLIMAGAATLSAAGLL